MKNAISLSISYLLLLFWFSSAKAETTDSEQVLLVKQFVTTSVNNEITQYAENQDWADVSSDINVFLPTSVQHLPQCPTTPLISAQDQQQQPIGTLKRQIRCISDDVNWRFNATIKVTVQLPVVVAKTTINRNTKLDASMLKMELQRFNRAKDFTTQPKDIIGQRALRRIRTGQIVSPNYLAPLWLVEKNEQVLIIASKHGIQASSKGTALENGALNEQIRVKNNSSQKIVTARVTKYGVVETVF